MYPSQYLEIQGYPDLRYLVQRHLDMQFEDLRTMLLLPRGKFLGGCNYATAALLLNVIAGSSVVFYEASEQALAKTGDRGKRFKEVIKKYYPWDGEDISQGEFAHVLYELARNPLVHALGLDERPGATPFRTVALLKWPLTRSRVLKLEESEDRPKWTRAAISKDSLIESGSEYTLSIPSLYWGVHQMLRRLFADPNQVRKADALAAKFKDEWTWRIMVL